MYDDLRRNSISGSSADRFLTFFYPPDFSQILLPQSEAAKSVFALGALSFSLGITPYAHLRGTAMVFALILQGKANLLLE